MDQTSLRMREFVLNPGETEQDYQNAVTYQGAIAYLYLADRSTCPTKGDRCDWQRPPRLAADVMSVVYAFYKVNTTGDPIPTSKERWTFHHSGTSGEFFKKDFGLLQILGIKPFGEPIVDLG